MGGQAILSILSSDRIHQKQEKTHFPLIPFFFSNFHFPKSDSYLQNSNPNRLKTKNKNKGQNEKN